jgi:hypothetical protein
MDFLNYIVEEALIVIPVLWIIGVFLKMTPKISDWTIIWILLVVGIALTIALLGLTPQAIIQGVLVAGAAVLGHQLLKQTIEKK